MKAIKEGCIYEENRTGGHGFTSGVSPKENRHALRVNKLQLGN